MSHDIPMIFQLSPFCGGWLILNTIVQPNFDNYFTELKIAETRPCGYDSPKPNYHSSDVTMSSNTHTHSYMYIKII